MESIHFEIFSINYDIQLFFLFQKVKSRIKQMLTVGVVSSPCPNPGTEREQIETFFLKKGDETNQTIPKTTF